MKVLVFKDIKNNRWTLWSIDRKKHLGYKKTFNLKDCELIVLQEKRDKVVRSGKRFPHAWIIGTLAPAKVKNNPITYNPFKNKNFVSQNKTVKKAKEIFFSSKGCVFKS
jgi:hypothetical protein